jgi:cellulose synthase/poly-beta-1,6-N-acetylglucosamine synthase-like glycosyltransferase
MYLAHGKMDRLRRPVNAMSSHPRVNVLIPAKDEGEAVRKCLDSVMALDYPHYSVIAIDDRSTDSTPAIFDEYAAKLNEKFTALHIPHGGLPEGWLGKSHALHMATAHVDADWILFVDSDVQVAPDALSAVLSLAIEREYDAVSILTRLVCHTFWERLLLPLCGASVGAMGLMSFTNNDRRKSTAFANGQFLLIRRKAYDAVGGHAAVRDNIVEDIAIMRTLKAKNFRTRLYFGRDFAATRMGTSLKQMFHGWARIFSGVSGRRRGRIVLAMLFVLTGLLSYAALVFGLLTRDVGWLVAGILHLTIVTGVLVEIYRMSGNPRRYAAIFPVGAAMMLAMYTWALRACRTGRIEWRGTHYASARAVHS